jgi:CRISPR-associated protein (TIGR03986 family)
MSDTLQGKLIFKGEGKDRRRHLVFTTRKGKTWDNPIGLDKLAPDLRSSTEAEIEVALETDPKSGQPYRVRREGQDWVEAGPTPQKAPRQSVSGIGETKNMTGRGSYNKPQPGRPVHQKTPDNSAVLERAFHNPYNFIPAPPRNTDKVKNSGLGDRPPAGHDRYYPNLYSGRLRAKMTVVTPLLLPDAARVKITDQGKTEHKSYPVRVDIKGNPYIEPTAIKGMLRSAYEAITNSRLSVFSGHNDRLAYRMPAKLGPVPAIVEKDKSGSLFLRIMNAAKLPQYYKGKLSREAKPYRSGKWPQHGDAVWVEVDRRDQVTAIEKRNPAEAESSSRLRAGLKGWICITGPNIKGKKFERVFLEDDHDPRIRVERMHEKLWEELINNYKATHVDDLKRRWQDGHKPQDYLGDEPGRTGWSRHIYEPDAEKLTAGTLCYVEFNRQEDADSGIRALLPVTISRRLFPDSPAELLGKELKPAKTVELLSPADRVFGWVNQEPDGKGAYRGQLRIGVVECKTDNAIEDLVKAGDPQDPHQHGLPLAILGQPKPQQGRFYVARNQEGDAQPKVLDAERGISAEDAGYKLKASYMEPHEKKSLRGRKVYPHHRNLPNEHWDNPTKDRTQSSPAGQYQEYRRPSKDGQEQRDNQNRSIQGWVKPDTVFEFNVHFTNLSAVELGALVWLLQLPEDHYHRFGGGKPLGFGSVKCEIVQEASEGCTGAEIADRLKKLDEVAPIFNIGTAVADYKHAVCEAYAEDQAGLDERFQKTSFIAAFLRGAQGFEKLPIRYPRTTNTPNPEGESFKWFVANSKAGRGYALGNLADDPGLPTLEE